MKSLIYILAILITPLFASADLLLERELFNSRNGESYVCRIHSDMKTELVHEGVSVGKFATEFTSSENNVKKWLGELKGKAKNKKFVMESKLIPQYAHRGLKQYSLFDGSKKLTFYTLKHHATKSRPKLKAKLGSIEFAVKGDGTNVQRLRGQTDEACKRAMAKL
ncbi:MAG: hypothetical protein IT287_03940 [Bdellovibrionaceae bacterium]|nr:hypothetical protein [Pseudobdellovibrionaceae bacterium]